MRTATYPLHGTQGFVLVNGRQAYLDNGRHPYKPVKISRVMAAAYIRFHRNLAPIKGQG